MPFALAAGIVAGGSILGAGINALGSTSAANTQAKAANKAADVSSSEFSNIATNLLPFLRTGTTANQVLGENYFGINPLGGYDPNAPFLQPISATVGAPPSPSDASLRAAFKASPGYDYELQQAMDVIQNSAAGRTGAVSGNAMKALQTNAAGLASTDWWNYYNALVNNYATRYKDIADQRKTIISGLGGLSTSGQNSAAQTGTFGTSAANTIGSDINLAGSSKAAGTLGLTNSITGGLNSLTSNSYLGQLLGGGSFSYDSSLYGGPNDYSGGGYLY